MSAEKKFSILVHLAKSDESIHPDELHMLYQIGAAAGLSKSAVKKLIAHPLEIDSLDNLTPYERFETFCHMIQVMKADHDIEGREMWFCRKMAINLGYDPMAIRAVSVLLDDDPNLKKKPDQLWKIVNDYSD